MPIATSSANFFKCVWRRKRWRPAEGGSDRVAAAREAIEGLGGKIDSFYFAFGETDVYVVADYPTMSQSRQQHWL